MWTGRSGRRGRPVRSTEGSQGTWTPWPSSKLATKRGMAGVEGGFVLRRDPDRVRSPDVWFLSHERLKEVAREGFYEGAPGLAVEVVSPGEEAEGVLAKVLDYLEAGAKAVWLVYPELKAVEVYGRGGAGRLLRAHEALEGGEALPGFRLPLEALFGQ